MGKTLSLGQPGLALSPDFLRAVALDHDPQVSREGGDEVAFLVAGRPLVQGRVFPQVADSDGTQRVALREDAGGELPGRVPPVLRSELLSLDDDPRAGDLLIGPLVHDQVGRGLQRLADGPPRLRDQARDRVEAVDLPDPGLQGRRPILDQCFEMVAVQLELAPVAGHLEEHAHLAPQDLRRVGLRQVVDGSDLVALEPLQLVRAGGGQEHDRDQPGLVVAAQVLGQLVAAHARHLHVQDRHGEVVVERGGEGLVAVGGLDDFGVHTAQDLPQGEAVGLPVVHDQDLQVLRHGRVAPGVSGALRRPGHDASFFR